MSMQQPIPPEQQSQVAPPAPAQPEAVSTPTDTPAPAPAVEPTPTDRIPEQSAVQEQQVIEQVAEGLADDEITAEDIMIAVLSDSLGLSPSGAQSLFQLLMSDLADDAQTSESASVDQPPME